MEAIELTFQPLRHSILSAYAQDRSRESKERTEETLGLIELNRPLNDSTQELCASVGSARDKQLEEDEGDGRIGW
jgi:hypothetical protein